MAARDRVRGGLLLRGVVREPSAHAMTALAQDDFHARRATGIGATDSAAILGLSRWGTPLSVYMEKLGLATPRDDSLPMWLGRRLQDVVAELFTAQNGLRVRADRRHHRHPQHEWLVCHLDYRVWGDASSLVEVKTSRSIEGWGEAGTDDIPVDYWVQCQHEMAVTGATRCYVAVLFGHYEYRTYLVERDVAFIERLIEADREFWFLNVLAEVEPLPTAKDTELVNRRHPVVQDPVKAATPEQMKLVERYKGTERNARQANTALEELKNQLKELIGEAAGLEGPGFRITWHHDKERLDTDWKMVARMRERLIEELFELASPGDDPKAVQRYALLQQQAGEAVGLYTVMKGGSRRFIAHFDEEDS